MEARWCCWGRRTREGSPWSLPEGGVAPDPRLWGSENRRGHRSHCRRAGRGQGRARLLGGRAAGFLGVPLSGVSQTRALPCRPSCASGANGSASACAWLPVPDQPPGRRIPQGNRLPAAHSPQHRGPGGHKPHGFSPSQRLDVRVRAPARSGCGTSRRVLLWGLPAVSSQGTGR